MSVTGVKYKSQFVITNNFFTFSFTCFVKNFEFEENTLKKVEFLL